MLTSKDVLICRNMTDGSLDTIIAPSYKADVGDLVVFADDEIGIVEKQAINVSSDVLDVIELINGCLIEATIIYRRSWKAGDIDE